MTDDARQRESSLWTIHGERVLDNTRRLRLGIASVELPDGVRFEQYVLRMPRAAMVVVLDDTRSNVLMIWRHRFVIDQWTWELPGGYVDPHEPPEITAAREVREETGWAPRSIRLLNSFQPMTGTADFENLVYIAEGAEPTGEQPDINEAARVEWLAMESIPDRIRKGQIVGAGAQLGLMAALLDM